jgi:hypothetical protein
MCKQEAVSFPERTEEFVDETGIAFSYVLALFEDAQGNVPDAEDALSYWEVVDEPDVPITADPDGQMFDATPFDGSPLPGKCILSPTMEILECEEGEAEDDWAFEIIEEHAAG